MAVADGPARPRTLDRLPVKADCYTLATPCR